MTTKFVLFRRALPRLGLIWLAIGLDVAPLWAQLRPNAAVVPVAPSAARFSTRELALKVAESIDAGDTCPGVNGELRLRRVPGKMIVTLPAGASSTRWNRPGQPLSGYELRAKPAREMMLVTAPHQEALAQRANPARLRQSLVQARAGGLSVNPVFLDPGSGLELLATERLIVMLKPGADARRYFGRL